MPLPTRPETGESAHIRPELATEGIRTPYDWHPRGKQPQTEPELGVYHHLLPCRE